MHGRKSKTKAEVKRDERGTAGIAACRGSAKLSAKLVKNAELKIYKGAPHGMCTTEKDKVNKDLLDLIKADVAHGKSRAA